MWKVIAVLAVLAAAVSGCRTVTEGRGDPNGIVGTWTRTVYAPDLPFTAELTFRRDGSFSFDVVDKVPGHTDSGGTYERTERGVVLHDSDTPDPGRYAVDLFDDRLVLTTATDRFRPRAMAISGVWYRRP
jgi:hypothetical protein